MIDFSRFNSLVSVATYFADNKRCKRVLAESRWGKKNAVCPICGEQHCTLRKDGRYRCNKCKHNFSVTVGTIFENTKIKLSKWFMAMYLISSHKKGISSHQLGRDLKVTQNTAWYMLMKIRSLYGPSEGFYSGDVELDEAYIGGNEKWKHESKKTEGTQGRSTKTKTPIFGIHNREGKIKAQVVEDTKASTLLPIIKGNVEAGSRIFTDEYIAYRDLAKNDFTHEVVFHNDGEYVVYDAHTNCTENFWSHFKRMIRGVYHFCTKQHLQEYVNEQVYRWNTRKEQSSERFEYMFIQVLHTITQEELKKIRRYHKKVA